MQFRSFSSWQATGRAAIAALGLATALAAPLQANAAVLVAIFEGTLGTVAAGDITNTTAWGNLTNLTAGSLTDGATFTGRLIIDKGLVSPTADLEASPDLAVFNPTNDNPGSSPSLMPPPNFLVLELTIDGKTYRGGAEMVPDAPFVPAASTQTINQILRREATDDVLTFTTFINAVRTDGDMNDFTERRELSFSFAGIPFADALPDPNNPPQLNDAVASQMTAILQSGNLNTTGVEALLRGTITSAVGLNTILGSAPEFPVLPTSGDGASGFNFSLTGLGEGGVGTDIPIFIDPVVAIGYDYEVLGGPNFASVLLPILPGGDNMFIIDFAGLSSPLTVVGGTIFDFTIHVAGGVSAFRVTGIDIAEGVDPNDPVAFNTGVTFDGTGNANVRMTPITFDTDAVATIAEPASFGLTLFALAAFWRLRRRPEATTQA